jgi:hypothetical protein
MRKTTIAMLALTALLVSSTGLMAATNNGLGFFFDTRDTMSATSINGGALGNAKWTTPIQPWKNEVGGGGRGAGQVRFVSPVIPAGTHVFSGHNSAVQPTFMYMDVDDRTGTGDVVSSVGVDLSIVKDSGDMGLDAVTGLGLTIFNADADTGGNSADDNAWDDTAVGAVGPTGITGLKMVRVPVNGVAPQYNASLGLGVGGSFRLARLQFTGGPRGTLPTTVGVFSAKLIVNDLLITRAFDPAGPAGATPELPDFGFLNGNYEQAAIPGLNGATGSSEGTTSATADLRVIVQARGDMNADGAIAFSDVSLFVQALNGSAAGTNNVAKHWPADFNNDNVITFADVSGLVASLNGWPVP